MILRLNHQEQSNGNNRKKNQKPCKINGYRRLKTATGIKMGTFVKKNKLNNSSKWFTFGQKIRPWFKNCGLFAFILLFFFSIEGSN